MIKRALALVAACISGPLLAAPIPVKDFAKRPEYGEVKISPGGEYLAVTVPEEDRTSLGFVRISDMKLMGGARLQAGEHVGDFRWVNNERVVIELAARFGTLEAPSMTGELFGINVDGSKKQYLHGYRGEDAVGSRISRVTRQFSWAWMVDTLRHDDQNVIVGVHTFHDDGGTAVDELYRLNVYTGQRAKLPSAPIPGDSRFLVDPQGEVRFASVRDLQNRARLFWREADGDWKEQTFGEPGASEVAPLRFSRDGRFVYLNVTGDRACLVRQEVGLQGAKELACGFNQVVFSFDQDEPIALIKEVGRRQIERIDTPHPDAALLAAMQRSFGGDLAEPVSATPDGSKIVFYVYSDRNPGDFYLFDKATKKAQYLISARRWLDPAQMGERRPVEFDARDGYRLHGYLTVPLGAKAEKLPLVVLPHGGPFYVRDYWGWDEDAQLLASRGYAVLQVNFRGSGGFGLPHVNAGRKKWGTLMIDDITDGARWAIQAGIAHPARMCIYGGSFGGYAALMSAVREPDLYRCAVGYAGTYDLDAMEWDTDINRRVQGQNYYRDYVGEGELLREQSPLTYIDKLKAPVLIVHGEEDTRTPYNQAKALRKALDRANHPYEWLSKPGEWHGFYKDANREEFYNRLLAFLERHIGEQPAPEAAAAP